MVYRQKLKPSLVALLVRIRGVRWDTVFTDPEREKYHVGMWQGALLSVFRFVNVL